MCKYSLEQVAKDYGTVDATQGDTLEIRAIRGFQEHGGNALVCLRTGTELTLTGEVIDWYLPDGRWSDRICEDVRDQAVTFEEREVAIAWHADGTLELQVMDILVRPDSRYTMIHNLCRGTTARVLQLPPVDTGDSHVIRPAVRNSDDPVGNVLVLAGAGTVRTLCE
jgi:hypothetical protein